MKISLIRTLACLILSTNAIAEDELAELKGLSLEALMDVEVTIAGKTPQKIADIPAAVYLVTQQDIQNMGATSIPEALRNVPGLQVARLDANKWSITSRGFNGLFANKLLVMIDGRTVYTPLFSGVNWDVQDTLIEDIERIEVIRGPGATLWGANAVNGVINIITKKAQDSQGLLLTGTLGSKRGIASARYGDQLAEDVFYRLYAKYRNQDNAVFEDGSKATDGWNDARGGFRIDGAIDAENQFTIQADFYQGLIGTRANLLTQDPPVFRAAIDRTGDIWGANLLTRWTQSLSDGTEQTLQFYYDHSFRDTWLVKNERDIVDLDYKYQFSPWNRHTLALGLGYRFVEFQNNATSLTETTSLLSPRNRQDHLFSTFIQDDIEVIADSVWLTLGSKFEHNDYSGFEIQPSARLRWKPAQGQLLWASVSRAVRTPSRAENDIVILPDKIIQPGVVSALKGNRSFVSEELIAYELGYRFQPDQSIQVDLSLFYNIYDNLLSFSPVGLSFPPQTAPLAAFAFKLENNIKAEAYGVELAIDWQPVENMKLRASYAFLKLQQHHNESNSADQFLAETAEKQAPEHQINILSSYQLTADLTLTLRGEYIDKLIPSKADSHFDMDLGLRYQMTKNLNIALFGKNLLHDNRFEYRQGTLAPEPTKIEREGYLIVELKF